MPVTFCPTPTAQQLVRRLPPLVVLRAPRGFGKTSTVAHWLRSGALDDRLAAWLSLSAPTQPDALWLGVYRSLVVAGVGEPTEKPGRASVEHVLRQLRQRLVLVIDGLHYVTDHGVDAALVELAQTYELLHVVVTSRFERPIVSFGPATVDTVVVDVPQLRLSAVEAGQLASGLGVSASEEELQDVVDDYAGWPILVRAALLEARRRQDGRLVVDPTGAVRYLGLLLNDFENEQWRDVVVALAVPEPLREGDVTALFDSSAERADAQAILERPFGVMRGGVIGYPHGLRHAILENLRTEEPQRYRELNERMSRRRQEQREPAEALLYATRAEAWTLALGILEENWAQLLRRHTPKVRAAVRAMPASLVDSSPRLVVARDYLLNTDSAGQAEAALRGGLISPGTPIQLRELTMTQRLALRFDGTPTYGAAEILLGRLDSELARGGPRPHRPDVAQVVPEILTEWGLSSLYDNDGVLSVFAFAIACQAASTLGDDAAAREAATGVALGMALLGHTGAADEWTTYAAGFDAPPSGLEIVAQPLVRTVLSGLRLGPVTWDEPRWTVREHGLTPLDELSRVAAAFAEILHGRLDRARVELQRHAGEREGEREEIVRSSVTALHVDLALAERRVDRAGTILATAERDGAWTLAARARHSFYIGAYPEALRLTDGAVGYATLRPRVGMEMILVRACAAWRTGDRETAVDHLATAVGIASDTGVLLPFLTVPRSDLEAMAPPGSWPRAFLDAPPLAGTDTVFPQPLSAGQLSAAELRVLRVLGEGAPLSAIGRRLFLSESTVKTHVRRIYRKLGVSSRAEALVRARELLLLE